MCNVLGVPPSGYCAWQHRDPSARAQEDAQLSSQIQTIDTRSHGAYWVPRVHAELTDEGIRAGRKRDARLMRGLGLHGVSRREETWTTVGQPERRPAPDLVQRDFMATAPNQLWVADITYIPTWAGFLYLAVVLDAFSRWIIGWAMATRLHTELLLDALETALMQRRPTDVLHHSDQGCQYTSIAFGQRCKAAGVRPSMGSAGDCYDNAMAEPFFATLECELLDRVRFPNPAAARTAVFEFIET